LESVDSGVDIEHEDLKSVIWTNSKEIAGNGIDDDKMDMLMIFMNFLETSILKKI
jgi:hypothetical protein